jgi:predicted dehydrogenase
MGAGAPHFNNIEACLAETHPDGVIVATPQFTHRAVAEACLRADVAVMVEKPLAHTLADARAMVEAARERPRVPTAVGLMLGFHPLFIEAARIIGDGTLGEIVSARASCYLSQVFAPNKGWTFTRAKSGGGVVINSGSHLLYAILLALGPARGVVARGSPVHNEVEDAFSALVDLERGCTASVDISWSVPGYEFQTHDLTVIGTNGALEVGNEVLRLWLVEAAGEYPKGWTERRRDATAPRAAFTLSPDYCGDEFYLEDLDFVNAIRDKRAPLVGWDVGLRVQESIDALYRSMESGQYVALDARAAD